MVFYSFARDDLLLSKILEIDKSVSDLAISEGIIPKIVHEEENFFIVCLFFVLALDVADQQAILNFVRIFSV